MKAIPVVMKITIFFVILLNFTSFVSSATTPCTNICYVGDTEPVNYLIDHNQDEVQIQQAINNVARYASAGQRGIVILKKTTTPYQFLGDVDMMDFTTLQGETLDTEIQTSPRSFGGRYIIQILSKQYVTVRDLTLRGSRTTMYCCGANVEKIINPQNSRNLLIENINGYDGSDDLIKGSGITDSVFRNIRYVNSGHDAILFAEGTVSRNNYIDNIYCKNLGNGCIRSDNSIGLTIKNMYSIEDSTNEGGYAGTIQFGVQLGAYPNAQDVLIENATIIHASDSGITAFVQYYTSSSYIANNITVKNSYIECDVTNACNGGTGVLAGQGGGILFWETNNVVIDNVVINGLVGGGAGSANSQSIRISNRRSTPVNTIIRNSNIVNNRYTCGIYGNGAITWTISNNNYWNNLQNTCGNAFVGTGATFNPYNNIQPTIPPTTQPTDTPVITSTPTVTSTSSSNIGIFPIADTSIKSGQPTLDRGGMTWIDVGGLSGNGNYRGFLMFNIPRTLPNTTIKSAILRLKYEGESRNTPTTIGVYRPSTSWNSASTWNSFTPVGGSWFDRNGVTFGTTPYAEVNYPLGSTTDVNFDVTALVQSYADGTYPNTGFFLKANEVENSYLTFHSSEASESLRPLLIIEYGDTPSIEFNNNIYALIALLSILGIVYVNGIGNKKRRR